jgi:hypothetical protein
MNVCHCLTVCFDQPEADENPKGDGDGEDVTLLVMAHGQKHLHEGSPLLGRPGMTPRQR